MGDLSINFNRSEFACKCGCGFETVDSELLKVLETVRSHFNNPVTITSGCRCSLHNSNVGGADNSKHLQGIAADIKVKDVPPESVYNFINKHAPNKYGVGLYDDWVHIDVRRIKARW